MPKKNFDAKEDGNLKDTCKACEAGVKREAQICTGCGANLPKTAFDKYKDFHYHAKCKNCEKAAAGPTRETQTCTGCGANLPKPAFDTTKDFHDHAKCTNCEKAAAEHTEKCRRCRRE